MSLEKPVDMGNLFIVGVRHLKLNCEHAVCMLHGTINQPWDPSSTAGTCATLLTDNNGDTTKLIFVMKDNGVTPAMLNEAYPAKCRVLIAEPFFKVFSDGTRGVRLEQMCQITQTTTPPSEVTSCDPVARVEAARVAGNALFKANDFPAAIQRYTEALQVFGMVCDAPIQIFPSEEFEVHKLLTNRAQCLLKCGDNEQALKDAEAAIEHAPKFVKGHVRKVSAVAALGRKKEAAELILNLPLSVPMTKIETKYFNDELAKHAGFPNNANISIDILRDDRVQRWKEYFGKLANHVYKCIMSAYFTASQRCNMKLTEDVGNADMTPEEEAEDLAVRENLVGQEETSARKALEKNADFARSISKFLSRVPLDTFSEESAERVRRTQKDLSELVTAHDKDLKKDLANEADAKLANEAEAEAVVAVACGG